MHPTPTTYAGIDWATRSHAVCVIDETGAAIDRYEVEHSEAGLRSLAKRLTAREVSETSAPTLIGELDYLANRASLPTPRAFIFDSDQPNAFATGQSPSVASVAVKSCDRSRLPFLRRKESLSQ